MADWLPIFHDWITPVIAVSGLGLSVWNTAVKWRENRKKEMEGLPWGRLEFIGQEKVEGESYSIRALAIEIHNSTRHRWKATHVRLVEPADAAIRPRGRPDVWKHGLNVDWVIASVVERGEERSEAHLDIRFSRQIVPDESAPLREVALEIAVQEVSAARRPHKFEARLIQHF